LKRRRKRKKDKEAKEKTLLALMNNNIRTMRRLRHTHARFAALGLSAGAPATDEFDQGGMPPPPLPPLGLPPAPLQAGLLSMPELPEREEDAVVGENEVDDRPWGIELGISSAAMRRRRKGKRKAGDGLPTAGADVEDDEPPDIEVGAANADQCMRWMGSKVLEHAGFQGVCAVISFVQYADRPRLRHLECRVGRSGVCHL
jgi:transcriptional activator SPT7